MSTRSPDPYKTYSCVTKFKNDLADHVGDIFARAVDVLLQGKLRPLINQYQMTNKMGRITNKVIGKYVYSKRTKPWKRLKAYSMPIIRPGGFDTSGARPISNIKVELIMPKT